MPERCWRWFGKRGRLLALLLAGMALCWGGKCAYDRLTASPAKWAAEMAAGDTVLAQYRSSYALLHYDRALQEARKLGGNDLREAKSREQIAKCCYSYNYQRTNPLDQISYFVESTFLSYSEGKASDTISLECKYRYAASHFTSNLNRAIHIRERLQGTRHPDLIADYIIFGDYYYAHNQSDRSIRAYRHAVALAEAAYGPADPRLIDSLQALARGYYRDDSRHDAARACAERLVNIGFQHPGADGKVLLRCLDIYRSTTDNRANSIPHLRRAAALLERRRLTTTRYLADIYENLGDDCAAEGSMAEAERAYWRSMINEERAGRSSYSQVNELKDIYKKQPDKVIAMYSTILAIRRSMYGNNHEGIAHIYDSFAYHYKKAGMYRQAEQYYQRKLAVLNTLPITKYTHIRYSKLDVLRNLHDIYRAEKRHADAVRVKNEITALEKLP